MWRLTVIWVKIGKVLSAYVVFDSEMIDNWKKYCLVDMKKAVLFIILAESLS